jgi:hypothetical protein
MTAARRTDLFGHPVKRTVGGPALVDVAAELRRETGFAFLLFDGTKEVWVPKSLVDHDPQDGTFTMPEWLAKDKGLT